MLPWLILGIALLVGFLLAARWFVQAEPRIILKVGKWLLLLLVGVFVTWLALSGRLAWALAVLPAVAAWGFRLYTLAMRAKTFVRMAQAAAGGGGQAGKTSSIQTRFLLMVLDHGTGEMYGEVVDGPWRGWRLADLAPEEVDGLWRFCRMEDAQSARVLEAYLDRTQAAGWRERMGGGAQDGGFAEAMTREEAARILGVAADASPEEVRRAHHRLIAALHPDRGGSDYLAAKINQAKDLLLK